MDLVIRHMIVRVDEEKKVVDRDPTQAPDRVGAPPRQARAAAAARSRAKAGRRATATIGTTIDLTGWRSSHAIWTRTIGRRRRRARPADKKTGDKAQGPAPHAVPPPQRSASSAPDKIDDINYKDVKLIGPLRARARQRFCRGGFRAPARCTSASCRRRSSAPGRSRSCRLRDCMALPATV